MFKKILLIFALFLTVAGVSALTTVWLSARPASALIDLTESRISALEQRINIMQIDIMNSRCSCY